MLVLWEGVQEVYDISEVLLSRTSRVVSEREEGEDVMDYQFDNRGVSAELIGLGNGRWCWIVRTPQTVDADTVVANAVNYSLALALERIGQRINDGGVRVEVDPR